jgi:inosose dehydratase
VDASLAAKVQSGQLSYTEAVRKGMYRPLGAGDVDVQAIVTHLSARGYDGWYVLEQDTILAEEPKAKGPVEDVWASAEHLRAVLRGVA